MIVVEYVLVIFLFVHNRFYLSKRGVDGSLHKAMHGKGNWATVHWATVLTPSPKGGCTIHNSPGSGEVVYLA